MWNLFNLCVRTLFPKAAIFLRNANILATEQGQWRSIRTNSSVDRHGQPLPWYTYPAIEYLDTLDFSACDIFEYGSGNSSRYWAVRARSVTSVEDNPQWHDQVRANALPNQALMLRTEPGAYAAAIAAGGRRYDVVVIDGNHRLECTRAAMERVTEGGMIVLDNSDRSTEIPCAALLRDSGFFQVDFCGFGPINGYRWSTSVFFRPTFSLRRSGQGPRPAGGLAA
jgi:precorrin-6B methylase 2